MPLIIDSHVPDAYTVAAIVALADRVERADGAPPLSDQARTLLGAPDVRHVVARDGPDVVGYAQLHDGSAELVVEPAALSPVLDAALELADGPMLVWSHGRRSRLIAPFAAHGFVRVRELFALRRPGRLELPPDPRLDPAITVRPFVVGRDEQAWLAVNAAAFAHHPEQGRTTPADLQAREGEPWFDPAGFLLAERDGRLLGFHWTKTHPDGAGEVYVLGVSPEAQGLGLGRALLVRGLHHLAEQGCPYVLLYVDGDNPGALRLYERDGFERFDLDVQWRTA
ncbi:MAG: mycothiol synthase [Jatrophihabitans sp.]